MPIGSSAASKSARWAMGAGSTEIRVTRLRAVRPSMALRDPFMSAISAAPLPPPRRDSYPALPSAGYVRLDRPVARAALPDPRSWIVNWPVYQQLTGRDRLGRGLAVRSPHTEHAAPRTEAADRVTNSVCPYCAVGCAQRVYVPKVNGQDTVTQIEGDPDSPVSRGRLCPKGSATKQLVTHPGRQVRGLYRPPYGK